jgi:hypothetical protein
VAANGIDDDQDGSTDELAVPSSLNPTAAAALRPSGDRWMNHDRDGDGWTLSQERLLGTAPNIAVGNPLTTAHAAALAVAATAGVRPGRRQ